MKAILSGLCVARFAFVAFALTSLSGVAFAAESITDRAGFFDPMVVKYWGNYSGPQIANPGSSYTTDYFGNTNKKPQNADDLITVGYQVTPDFRPGIGIPFNFVPMDSSVIQTKQLYFGIIDATLLNWGNLTIHTDFRIYTPIGYLAAVQDVKTGVRASQVTLYPIPGSRFTVGCYTYVRAWMYGANGTGRRNDFEIYLSPFASYKIVKGLYATVWSDWLQLGHQYGTSGGLKNLPVDIQPGIRWDVTSKLSLNPYLNLIPSYLTADNISLGLVVNAQIL